MKTIDKNIYIPYGLEIEMESVDFLEGRRALKPEIDDTWIVGDDITLNDHGLELTSPVLKNNPETIERLKRISKTIEFLRPTFDNCSFQINLDAYFLDNYDIQYLLKIFSIYENIIYRFSMGIDEKIRDCYRDYAIPIGRLFTERYYLWGMSTNSYYRLINNEKYAISFKTLTRAKDDPIKVIEFRTPNGTVDFNLWMNYVVFFSSFMTMIRKRKYDKKIIDKSFSKLKLINSLDKLLEIDESKAREFANLIYISENEKNRFYSQYFEKKILKR